MNRKKNLIGTILDLFEAINSLTCLPFVKKIFVHSSTADEKFFPSLDD
jgi:hypothetical protein